MIYIYIYIFQLSLGILYKNITILSMILSVEKNDIYKILSFGRKTIFEKMSRFSILLIKENDNAIELAKINS
jgi:hypothetical protein